MGVLRPSGGSWGWGRGRVGGKRWEEGSEGTRGSHFTAADAFALAPPIGTTA